MSSLQQLRQLVERGQVHEACELIRSTPELTDLNDVRGRSCYEMAITSDSYHLTKAMLTKVSPQDLFNGTTGLEFAALKGSPNSMRAMLEHTPNPGIVPGRDSPILIAHGKWTQESEQAKRDNDKKAIADLDRYKNCVKQLLHAGQHLARDSEGVSVLERALKKPLDQATFLVQQGADMEGIIDYRGKVMFSCPENVKRSVTYYAVTLNHWVGKCQKTLGKLMKTLPPEQLLAELDDNRPLLYTLLSANAAQALSSPEYWNRHGGAEGEIAFFTRLKAVLPEHNAYMRARLSTATLNRESPLTQPDSVTVQYLRGATAGELKR